MGRIILALMGILLFISVISAYAYDNSNLPRLPRTSDGTCESLYLRLDGSNANANVFIRTFDFMTSTSNGFTSGQSSFKEDISNDLQISTTGNIGLSTGSGTHIVNILGGSITDSTGIFNFDNDHIQTTGNITAGNILINGNLNVTGCIIYNSSETPVTLGDCL